MISTVAGNEISLLIKCGCGSFNGNVVLIFALLSNLFQAKTFVGLFVAGP